jgi:hypothetical protein
MGYYVYLTSASFDIPDTPEVRNALRELDKRDDLKRGGSFGGGKEDKWFSWMNEPWAHHESIDPIFQQLGFDTYCCVLKPGEHASVQLLSYDSKIGQEALFLAAVAPFVKAGSYLEWRGEDGEAWRHYVGDDGKLYVQESEIHWTNEKEVAL